MPENIETDNIIDKNINEDSFTMSVVLPTYKRKLNGGAITFWIFSLLSLIGGIALVATASPGQCKDPSCSLGLITQLSFGVMSICIAAGLALIGFMVLTGTEKREEARGIKEDAMLKEALAENFSKDNNEDSKNKTI